ncbi:acyl-CoA thioesterase [Amycolatopsis acidiphila]|uniref:Acyl-CoA thioesterase n=1 Tax=Amycolatopsis acidiphila TaxID=715473 RepID=A0A558A7A0_9PSEU|nr:thioesterase family protein [Amycolatopsis acidiphila]TVT20144.1 acyl-CoA thioesterase [Amycolatopsis acidiphila]UIJ63863.1 acyl-CoA thioesterase [Amycolatopsis acidiphila]
MPLRVRFHECDPQGIVFNAHYLAYFDMASFEFFREVFGSYDNLRARGVDTVVAESNLRYRAPSHYDEELVVAVTLDHLGTTSLVLGFTVLRGEEVLTTGMNRYVFVDAETLAKTAPPDDVREKLAARMPE